MVLAPGPGLGLEEDPQIDPWEPVNRKVFAFNETLDTVSAPGGQGYTFVMPDVAQRGVTNFIRNMYEFNSVFNSLFQGALDVAAQKAVVSW